MSRSIESQITYAIGNNFSEGVKKREYKNENGRAMNNKIFSYSEKIRLKDTGKMLGQYIKENYSTIRQVKDISPEIIQSFLVEKKEANVTQNTLNTYSQSLWKIQHTLKSTYSSFKQDWKSQVTIPTAYRLKDPTRGSGSVMSSMDYIQFTEYCKVTNCESSYAVRLQGYLGIRVAELVNLKKEDFNNHQQTLKIKGKGGKKITRCLDKETTLLISEIIEKNFGKGRGIFSIKPDSVNRFLRRTQNKLGFKTYHSIHDIRRMIAQAKYDKLINEGLSVKEALNKVSRWLAHGDNRHEMIIRSYINITSKNPL